MRNGLRFFSDDVPASVRRRRLFFVVVLIVTAAALVWPLYVPYSGIRPLIFGLPLSMAWIVIWLTVMFAALLWLYRSDS